MNKDGKPKDKILKWMYMGTVVFILAVILSNAVFSPKFTNSNIMPSFAADDSGDEVYHNYSSEDEDSVFPIGINTATSEELQLIPDIGPVTAKLIIDYRNEYGTIVDFDELLNIEGIGKKTVEILKEYCIIN